MAKSVSTMVQVHVARQGSGGSWEFLVLRRSPDLKIYPGLHQCVTGRMEPDETAVATARREVFEETGLHAERMWVLPHVATWYSPHTDTIEHTPCFGMLVQEHSTVVLSGEHDGYAWLGYEDALNALIIPSQKLCLEIFRTTLSINAHNESWNMIYEIAL